MKKEQKMTPELRFKGFSDDWEQRKLREFLQKAVDNRGKTPPVESEGRYPLLEVASLGKPTPDYSKVTKYVDEKTYQNWFRSHVKKNDILFSTVGNTGLVALMDNHQSAVIAQNIVAFRAYEDYCPEFLVQMFQLPENFKRTKRIEMGAVQPSIKVSQLVGVSYLLPNNGKEQQQIGTFFQQLDTTITLHQRKLDALKQMKKGLLQVMFPANGESRPRLRFADFDGIWEQRKLEELADFSKGSGYSKADLAEKGNSIILYGRLYTKYETVITKVDTFVELKDGAVISVGGEVIVPASGESSEEIARASVVDMKGVVLGGDLNIIKTSKTICPIFLAISISNGAQQKELSKKAQGKSVVHIRNNDLKEINLKYPSFKEQQQIGTFFQQLDFTISLHQKKIDKLQQIKKIFLKNLFI